MVLNTCHRSPYHFEDQSGITDRLLHEAFQRMGREVIIKALPAERALINANAGVEDGDAARMEGIEKLYPDLIRVPEVFLRGELVAFSKKSFPITDWKSLNPYNVAIIKGHQKARSMLDNPASVLEVQEFDLLFELLEKDRADVVICERYEGLETLKALGIRDVRIYEPPLLTLDVYVYLHKKHSELVPALAQALQEMKEDGTFTRFLSEFEAGLHQPDSPDGQAVDEGPGMK